MEVTFVVKKFFEASLPLIGKQKNCHLLFGPFFHDEFKQFLWEILVKESILGCMYHIFGRILFYQIKDNTRVKSYFRPKWMQFFRSSSIIYHTTYSWNIKCQKCACISGLWVLNEIIQKNILKIWKKSWEPFGSYLLNSTANPAHFQPNWAGLAVLFSRQLLNGSQDFFFFHFNTFIFIYFLKYKTI